jgi:hypothetical protein
MADHHEDLVEVEAIFQTVTDRAVCVKDDEDGEDIWLPFSVCIFAPNPNTLDRGDTITASVPEWLAERKGLI